jgi:DNA-binding MurR/RpiR family transcriptional regulator
MKKIAHPSFSDLQAGDAAFAASNFGRRLLEMTRDGSASNRAIADYVVRHPVRVAALGIEEVAASIPVSAATLSRFARATGFTGYAGLRNALAETVQAILQPVEKLRETFQAEHAAGAPIAHALEATIADVRATVEALTSRTLSEATRKITTAETVYVVGFGLSAHLAGLLTLGLQPFCKQLINVVEFGGSEIAAGRLMNVGRRDTVIVISFPRYARDAVQLVGYAATQGAHIIAITDSPASPLAQYAGTVLLARSNHRILSSSYVAALAVVETMVASLMISTPANVSKAARLTDAISNYMYRHDGPDAGSKALSRPSKRRSKN